MGTTHRTEPEHGPVGPCLCDEPNNDCPIVDCLRLPQAANICCEFEDDTLALTGAVKFPLGGPASEAMN